MLLKKDEEENQKMINSLLKYDFKNLEINNYAKDSNIVKAVDLNSFDHDNYKKDTYDFKSIKGKNYYGKKRRYYTDYC